MTDLQPNLITAQQNRASVVFQLRLDPGHAINSHVARFNMYLPGMLLLSFILTKQGKNNLVLWLFAKA